MKYTLNGARVRLQRTGEKCGPLAVNPFATPNVMQPNLTEPIQVSFLLNYPELNQLNLT